jgi:hypothetical protein
MTNTSASSAQSFFILDMLLRLIGKRRLLVISFNRPVNVNVYGYGVKAPTNLRRDLLRGRGLSFKSFSNGQRFPPGKAVGRGVDAKVGLDDLKIFHGEESQRREE